MPHLRKITEVFLKPGEYFVGNAEHRIGTLLGSCVSITIWHPRTRVGAMSHFLLPTRGGPPVEDLDGRYGDEALWLMLHQLAVTGVAPAQCEAKIFGGGDMFPAHTGKGNHHVGKKNGLAARAMLKAYGISVVSESLFGEGHRRIFFDVRNGHVWSRQTQIVDAANRHLGMTS